MADLKQSIETFAQALADKMESFVSDISELEVKTFTVEGELQPNFSFKKDENGDLINQGEIKLGAYTQISFDGDTTICVPQSEGVIDASIWNLHQTMVSYAMQNRATMLKTIGDAAAAALKAVNRATSGE